MAWILEEYGAELLPVPTEEAWNITGSLIGNPPKTASNFPVYRFIPGKTRGEGLFMAVIRKRGEDENLQKEVALDPSKAVAEAKRRLRILSYGVKAGIQKGKTIIPDHTLALSITGDTSIYPNIEVDYPTAISYLRHEAITLGSEVPRGIVLLPISTIN